MSAGCSVCVVDVNLERWRSAERRKKLLHLCCFSVVVVVFFFCKSQYFMFFSTAVFSCWSIVSVHLPVTCAWEGGLESMGI